MVKLNIGDKVREETRQEEICCPVGRLIDYVNLRKRSSIKLLQQFHTLDGEIFPRAACHLDGKGK